MSVSVAMAAYNGAKYIEAQIESILKQLDKRDELIVSCDPSKDGTERIVAQLAALDNRIKQIAGPGKGVVKNFESAISACQNDYVFLSDQDDIWLDDKVQTVLSEFAREDAGVILHDAKIADENLQITAPSFFEIRKSKAGYVKNIIKNSYIGCCMAFKKELKEIILPFPASLPMHDQWIGLLGSRYGGSFFLKKPLILYRRHQGNVSAETHAGIFQMLTWRFHLMGNLRRRLNQCKNQLNKFPR